MNKIEPQTAFTFANSFEMMLSLFLAVMLAVALFNQTDGFKDLIAKFRKMTKLDFQGGPYDVLIALFVLCVGMLIRSEATWEWRSLGWELSVDRLSIGVFLKGVATFCLIRIFMPTSNYNRVAFILLVIALGFSFWNVAND